MNVSRLEELLNAELDGTLGAREQAELQQLLATTNQALETRMHMQELDKLLRELPEHPFPEFLHYRILSAISLTGTKTRSRLGSWLRTLSPEPTLRYGMAMAAALVVAVALFRISGPGIHEVPNDTMVGSMVPQPSGPADIVIDRLHLSNADYSSDVTLQERSGRLLMNVVLDASMPVDIAVNFQRAGLHFDSIEETRGALESVSFSASQLRLRGTGRKEFTIFLRREEAATSAETAEIQLEFSSDGAPLRQGILKPPN